VRFRWLVMLVFAIACEAPQPTPDVVQSVQTSEPQPSAQCPTSGKDDPCFTRPEVVEPLAEPVRPSFVERSFESPSCEDEGTDEPFNSKNIDPLYDSAFESPYSVPFQDGLVRVRFDVSLPMAQVLEVRKTKTHAVKVEFVGGGVRVADGPKQPLYKVDKVKEIEALVWLMGTDILVQVHDAQSGLELLTVHTKDATSHEGAVVWSGAKTNLLVTRASCSPMAPMAANANPLPRYFEKPLDTILTPDLVEVEKEADTLIVATSSRGLESAFCATKALPGLLVESPWRFIDPDYAAWRTTPPVQVDGRLRFDLSYKSPQMVQELLAELHKRFPEKTRLEQIGLSSQGRPILALVIANSLKPDDIRPPILINGAYHGDEILSTDVVFDALDVLLYGDDPRVQGWLDHFVFWIVPMVNPDGVNEFLERSQFSGRKNARDLDSDGLIEKREGVDLNRNFPVEWGTLVHEELEEPYGKWYRGPKAGSESETKAMMGLVDRERFVASLSYHTGTTAVMGGYSIDTLKAPMPDESVTMAKVVAKDMGKAANGRTFRFRKNLYPVEGVDQDWMRFKHGTIALLIEASRGSPVGWCKRKASIIPGRKAWMALLDELASGPLVIGRATRQGKAALVPVSIEGQRIFNSEIWTSRPRDGRFFRFLSKGQDTLLVAGKKVSTKGVEAFEEIEVVLP
jgi:hypothetical protein